MATDQPVTTGRIVHVNTRDGERCIPGIVNQVESDPELGAHVGVVIFPATTNGSPSGEQRYLDPAPSPEDEAGWHWPERPVTYVSSPALEALASGS